jgi:hypothetical protein
MNTLAIVVKDQNGVSPPPAVHPPDHAVFEMLHTQEISFRSVACANPPAGRLDSRGTLASDLDMKTIAVS